tara:strand:+ start:125 stop:352 length:228 start_codon:yes stop_codon:yes gene_type:complete
MNDPQLLPPEQQVKPYVIRLPGVFLGFEGDLADLSFQTVVMAKDIECAWDVALSCEIWEKLPFSVDSIQIFPSNP